MPRGDGTGPMGMGPMTGRAAGFCAGYGMPGYMNPVPRRGFGMGFGSGRGGRGGGFGGGGGRGWRNMYYATGMTGWQRATMGSPAVGSGFAAAPASTREQQIEVLRGQAELLGGQLEAIQKRIEELSAPGETK